MTSPEATPAVPPTTTTEKTLSWPDWHGVADLGAATLIIIVAFLVSSFNATNSDIWPQLAYGKMWKGGQTQFGVDPFSYATEGRYWANHSWLWSIAAHTFYQSDPTGAKLVTVKAGLLSAALVVFFLIRRKGSSLWPWVVMGTLAVIAGASFAQLRSFIVNPLGLMLTMFILFRLPWKAGSFRNAILLSVLFAVWGNLDNGFVFGPILVAATLAGQVIQSFLIPQATKDGPSLKDLGLAFVISAVACMANPHHIHVWQWPSELAIGFPEEMADDRETMNTVLSPVAKEFYESPVRGYNVNGLCLLLVYLGTIGSLALSFRTVPVSHLLVALTFASLGLRSISMILPVVFVLAAISAMAWNRMGDGIVLKTWGHVPSRLFLLFGSIGRMLTVTVALLLVPCAWPGWLHPSGMNRRASWAIEPDEGLVAAAKTIDRWRTNQLIPPESKRFHASFEFANYVAWFAPGEKVFLNSRWNYHRPEILKFLQLRYAVLQNEKEIDVKSIKDGMQSLGVDSFTTITRIGFPGPQSGAMARLFEISREPDWTVRWYSGRGLIVGLNGSKGPEYHPADELFRSELKPLPQVVTLPPLPPRESWADDFMVAPKTMSSGVNDTQAMIDYSQILNAKFVMLPQGLIGSLAASGPRPLFDDELCVPLLALREARRAVAENPDDYRSFSALLQAYSSRQMPELFNDTPNTPQLGERKMQMMTIGQRILARLPSADRCSLDQAVLAYNLCEQMVGVAMQSNQRDLAFELFGKMKAYFKRGPGVNFQMNGYAQAKSDQERKGVDDQYKKILEDFDKQENQIEQPVLHAKGILKRENPQGIQKFMRMANEGLVLEAIAEFESTKDGEKSLAMAFQTALLMLNTGMLERAVPLVAQIRKTVDDPETTNKTDPRELQYVMSQLPELEFRTCVLEGNVRQASDTLERFYARMFPPLSPEVKKQIELLSPESAVAAYALGNFPYLVQSSTVEIAQQNYQQQLIGESRFAFQSALLAIVDGRVQDARMRLKQCLAPQGITKYSFVWTPVAKRYLAMIERDKN